MKIGEYLLKIRIEKGMTVRDVETKSGISNAQISRIENGLRNPTLTTIDKILKAQNIPWITFLKATGFISTKKK